MLALVLAGWAIFALAYPDHLHATRATKQLPQFRPLVYAVDAVLPVVNLGYETAWTPTGISLAWYVLSVVSGWLLSLGLVAYLTAKLFRP